MLRHYRNSPTRRRPARVWAAVFAGTCLTLASLPAIAALSNGTGGDAGAGPVAIPYLGGSGDPAGLTSTHYAEAGPARPLHADAAGTRNPFAAKVRNANARFADVAVALAEGYAPIPCVSGVAGGGMGIHYVNATLLEDEALDVAKPEAVMYEPQADGSLRLVAVEYITTKGPASLEGHLFSLTGAPNRYGLPAFYELHVWAWRDNPAGTFADMNPTVSCDAAVAAAN